MFLVLGLMFIITVGIYIQSLSKDYVKTSNGTPVDNIVATQKGHPYFRSSFATIGLNAQQVFYYSRDNAEQMKRSYIQYVFGVPVYNIIDAEDAELVLSDINLIDKGTLYNFLHPHLKTGLLTSAGQKWHNRRKLLTPAFHFKIMEQFLEVFKHESTKFIDMLNELNKCNKENGKEINLSELVPRFTLNTICETALGVQLDDCQDADEYRQNISIAEKSFINRALNPFWTTDFAYNTFGKGRFDLPTLKKLHQFTSNIIEKRRENFNENSLRAAQSSDMDGLNTKQRYAMLDTMLLAEKDGLIDHAGICEEVDTFVFEGFDTTSMNLIFGLTYLANHPDKQQKCYEEIQEVFGDDLDDVNVTTLGQLKYLECCVKETLRLCPSVPSIMRESVKETTLANNLVIPKRTQIVVYIFDIQRNPKYYDYPNDFIPERFLPENSLNRHPFAFIPFSAGRRNCIGQKFALAEIKTLMVYILKNYRLETVSDMKKTKFLSGLLLRPQHNLSVKIVPRSS